MNESHVITVRYWASARAVVGVAEEQVPVDGTLSLAALREVLARRHPAPRVPAVLAACSVLVGERPVSSQDPAAVEVLPGEVVEFLPPFAGG